MSRGRKVFSIIVGLLLVGCGSAVFFNWLFLGGGLPKFASFGAGLMIAIGVMIAWEDISDWWAGR